jgi:branched-chain amino acid transport system permease protein
MRVVNVAHGDFSVLAAYLALVVVNSTGINPLLSVVIVAPVMFVVGYLLQRGIINFTLSGGVMPPLLVTFGLSVVIQNVLLQVFSADSQGLRAGSFEGASIRISDQLAVGWLPLTTFITAVAILLGLQILFSRSRFGRAFRATADDEEAAQLMGIDNRHFYGMAMGIALATVAVAGVFIGLRTTFQPSIGPAFLIFAFEAVVVGGLGSLWGTLVGGIILGVAQTVGAQINPGWGVLSGHLVFLAVLAFRPSGLLGPRAHRVA